MAFLYLCHTYNYKPENKFLWCTTNALCTRIFTPHTTACFCRVFSHYEWDYPTFFWVLCWADGLGFNMTTTVICKPRPQTLKRSEQWLILWENILQKNMHSNLVWTSHFLKQWYTRSLNFPPSPHLPVPKNRWSVFG